MRLQLLCCFILLINSASFGQDSALTINVHPGVELLTIIQKLAGRYPHSTQSIYEKEVMSSFNKFKTHPAVLQIQNFKGNVYPDLPELGFCFSDFPNFTLNIPDSTKDWYRLYGKENVIGYLKSCKDFASQTGFWRFYTEHQDNYKLWANPVYDGIKKDSLLEKLNNFYRTQTSTPKFYICLDALNSWGAHAIPNPELFNPAYKNIKAYVIGFFSNESDSSSEPIFSYGDYATNLAWHEGSHIFIEDLFVKYKSQIDSIEYLYNKDDNGMKSQNINNWNYCLNENVVRGIVIALFKKYKSERAWKKQNASEILNDFIYAEEISKLILKEYINTKKYKSFNDFFPVLLNKLKQTNLHKPAS